jgi:hypothetical protein
LIKLKKTWPAAKVFCEKKGGHLFALETEEEHAFVTNIPKLFETISKPGKGPISCL